MFKKEQRDAVLYEFFLFIYILFYFFVYFLLLIININVKETMFDVYLVRARVV